MNLFVRPHPEEYFSPIWNPTLQYMATTIEKVQRATKLVYRFDEIPYEDRLRELDLHSLQFRWHREDSITAFKICKFYPDLKYIFSFQPREGLLGHDFCFHQERGRSRLFKNSLPNRLFATWNGLPPQFAQIPNLKGLKRFLDDRYGLARYTCRLLRSGLGPGVDVGLTEFVGAGCVR